jgi:hypothetical protein
MHLSLQNNQSLLLNYVKFRSSNLITKPLQSLRFDTLNIALSYKIRYIASGIFIIDNFGHEITTSVGE